MTDVSSTNDAHPNPDLHASLNSHTMATMAPLHHHNPPAQLEHRVTPLTLNTPTQYPCGDFPTITV
jgi:hypothetical protein